MARNGSISADWFFRVANFEFHYLRYFSIDFWNSCAHMFLQIFWSFWNSPNILNLHVFQGCYGQKPKKLEIRKYVNLSQPWNLTFLENEIFQLFFQSDDLKVLEWKIAHIEWSNNEQNIRKSPKNKGFRGTYCLPPFWEHPVVSSRNQTDCWMKIEPNR